MARQKVILGIHSNVEHDEKRVEGGHSWVSVNRNGEIATYSSWPSNSSSVRDYGQANGWNGTGTDIQKDIETQKDCEAVRSTYWDLNEQQQEILEKILNDPHQWELRVNNCATWVASVASEATGQDISAQYEFADRIDPQITHRVDAPQGISKSIYALEQEREKETGRDENEVLTDKGKLAELMAEFKQRERQDRVQDNDYEL